MTYNTDNYEEQGGGIWVVGGELKITADGSITAAGTQASNIVDLTDSSGGTAGDTVAAISGSGADTDINNNFASLTAKINALIVAVEGVGITAS